MKSAVFLPLCVLFASGCSKPVPPAPPAEKLPVAEVEATPVPSKTAPKVSYVGAWSASDEQGQLFNIVIFPNGQAVSNWTKGASGARGERGFWRVEGDRLLVLFQDGWTDVISESATGFEHQGFEPGSALDGHPKNKSTARRLDGDGFTGVWCLNKEPDGSFLYVALQSSGRAMSTIGGGTEGTWEKTDEGAQCKWPDGWNDLIFASNDGFLKRSWVGPAEQNSTPADISPALRVGDAKFAITP